MLAAGLMHTTVAQDPYAMGRLTAELANRLINGETLVYDNPGSVKYLLLSS